MKGGEELLEFYKRRSLTSATLVFKSSTVVTCSRKTASCFS